MSFLEKLQKGMGIQRADTDESAPEEGMAVFASYKSKKGSPEKSASPFAEKKTKTREQSKKNTANDDQSEEIDGQPENEDTGDFDQTEKINKKSSKKTMAKKLDQTQEDKKEWLNGDGQLTVNVYQTENDLVVQSAIAGIKVEDLDVIIEDDLITIKGNRANPLQESGDYFIEECYWGSFSRKIILPVEVDSSRADAAMKDGILTIRIPKIQREKKKKVIIKQ